MKTRETIYCLLALFYLFLWVQCDPPRFDTIDHPFEVKNDDTVEIPITMVRGVFPLNLDSLFPANLVEKMELVDEMLCNSSDNRSGDYLWLGMQLPENWTVLDSFDYVAYDAIPATIIDSGIFVYSPTIVSYLNDNYTFLPGNKWMAWETADPMEVSEGIMWSTINMVTDNASGYHLISYGMGFDGSLWRADFRWDNPTLSTKNLMEAWVTHTSDSGEGSLRKALFDVRPDGKVLFSINCEDTIRLDHPITMYRPAQINEENKDSLVNILGPDTNNIFHIDHKFYNDYYGYSYESNLYNLNLFGAGKEAFSVTSTKDVNFYNVHVHDNQGSGLQMMNQFDSTYKVRINNCKIYNNSAEHGGGIKIKSYQVDISNSGIYDNLAELGGGIYISGDASVSIDSTTLSNNMATDHGGGFFIGDASAFLSNTTISNNSAKKRGGGIYIKPSANLEFNTLPGSLSNIYKNHSPEGSDLFSKKFIEVTLDTFTVITPTKYHASPFDNFSFSINHGYYEQVTADLYVSPEGDNHNSGLTEQEPLQNIHDAFVRILADSANQFNVNLLEGTYAPLTNNEMFPLYMPDYVGLKGVSDSLVTLNAENTAGVVYIEDNHTNLISGLTLTGGKAEDGGGIYCIYSDPIISNLTIMYNEASHKGGGIFMSNADPVMNDISIVGNEAGIGGGMYMTNVDAVIHHGSVVGNTADKGGGIFTNASGSDMLDIFIATNHATNKGGGIYFGNVEDRLRAVTITGNEAQEGGGIFFSSNLKENTVFDDTNRCNIFFNKAIIGNDIYGNVVASIIVDTFSVMHPGEYYVESSREVTFDIWNAKRNQVEADLYVSPSGDNSNTGLTPDQPLKNIRNAFEIIRAEKEHQHTIYLLEGTYSNFSNNTSMPIYLPDYVEIKGVSENDVILDAEGGSGIFHLYRNNSNVLSGMTLTGGNSSSGGGLYMYGADAKIHNLTFRDNMASQGGGIYFKYSTATASNITLLNNSATREGGGIFGTASDVVLHEAYVMNNQASHGGGMHLVNGDILIENSLILKNTASGNGGGLLIAGKYPILRNCLITRNYSATGAGLYLRYCSPELLNLTIAHNAASDFGGALVCERAKPLMTNSILWSDTPQEIYFTDYASIITTFWSDIQGGKEGIVDNGGLVEWMEGNISEDPGFNPYGTEEDQHSLSVGSPCIDAGTPDTSGLNLPEYDLLGNLRIWDGDGNGTAIVDMGAYEFASMPVGLEPSASDLEAGIHCFPNPFYHSTCIEFELAQPEKVEINIFNQSGQLIKTALMNGQAGTNKFTWYANALPSGIYSVHISTDIGIITRKIIKLK